MTTALAWYLAGHVLAWLGSFRIFRSWAGRPGGYRHKAVVGMILAPAFLLSTTFPATGLMQVHDEFGDLDATFALGAALVALAAVLGITGLLRFNSRLKSVASFGACPTESDPEAPGEARALFPEGREHLLAIQGRLRERLGRSMPLVLSETLACPVLVGLHPCRIYVPVIYVHDGGDLEGLLVPLAQFAARWRYRAYVFLW
jgi:hypothetical protein